MPEEKFSESQMNCRGLHLSREIDNADNLHEAADAIHNQPERAREILNDLRYCFSLTPEEKEALLKSEAEKGLRKLAEKSLERARELAEEYDWPNESRWNQLTPSQKNAAIRGIFTTLRVAKAKRPNLKARIILAGTRFEEESAGCGRIDGLRLITVGPIKKYTEQRIPKSAEIFVAQVMSHETGHALELPHAIVNAIGKYTAMVTNYPAGTKIVVTAKSQPEYTHEEIMAAEEPKEKEDVEKNEKSNAYWLGTFLGREAYQMEEHMPNGGVEYLRNLVSGMGTKKARRAVIARSIRNITLPPGAKEFLKKAVSGKAIRVASSRP